MGHSEKHDNISSFRADRICHIELSEEDAAKKPAGFDLDRYSRQIFEMYDGDTVRVKLECMNPLMKYVIDRFGENVVILSILVYTLFSRMFDLMQPPAVKHSIAVV